MWSTFNSVWYCFNHSITSTSHLFCPLSTLLCRKWIFCRWWVHCRWDLNHKTSHTSWQSEAVSKEVQSRMVLSALVLDVVMGLGQWLSGCGVCCASIRTWVKMLSNPMVHICNLVQGVQRQADLCNSLASQPSWTGRIEVEWETLHQKIW